MSDTVLVSVADGRMDIVLHRPERRNAVNAELAEALAAASSNAAARADIGCILLSGAGGAFCSGLDVAAPGAAPVTPPVDAWIAAHVARYRCNVPVVVALERYAINAGAALALCAEVVVAGESSFLQTSEIALGMAAPMCQAWLHLRHSAAVGDRLTLLGDRVPAAELLRLGLATEVVADDLVLTRARELADRIAGHPAAGRAAIAATWRRLRGELDDPSAWFRSMAGRAQSA
ncbi:MAG: enoyl-CoA hydratase/isomerase family protein [Ilumatobacteraceae bacterium]